MALKGKPSTRGPKTQKEKDIVAAKTRIWAEARYKNKSFDDLSLAQKKRRILEEQENKCNKCSISNWNGKPLTLELEHKDGDTKNNNRDNLECICPNCHSQTDTWRGKNIKKKISNEELLNAIKSTSSIAEALRLVGLPDKGDSYARARRLVASIKVMQ